MNNIYTVILIIVTIGTTIYNIWKWVKEKRDASNKTSIWLESLKLSSAITTFVLLFILLVYFTNISEGMIYDLLNIFYILFLFISILIGFVAFIRKEIYKDRYGDIIYQDCLRYRRESQNAYSTINYIQSEIGKRIIENDFTYKVKLEHAKKIYNSIPDIQSITKKYNKLCQKSWLSVAGLNGLVILSLFDAAAGKTLEYVMSSILITFIMFVANSLNIYNDLRIKYGKRNSTIAKIKSHQDIYEKLLKKNKHGK